MSKKKKVAPVVRPPTKRQLSRWQKQKRQQRIIFGIGAVVIAAVLILVGSGIYFGWYVPVKKPLRNTLLEVGDTRFSNGYLIDSMKYQLDTMMGDQWQWYYAYMYSSYILDIVTNAEVMRQEAEKMGIVVSEDEINEQLQGHPDRKNRALRDIVRAALLEQKLRDEYFAPQLPVNPEQRQIMAMLLESQSQLDEVRAKLASGDTFGELAGEYSLDNFTGSMQGDLGFRPRGVLESLLGSTVIEEAVFTQELGVLSQVKDDDVVKPVGYWLIKVTEIDEDGIAHLSAMLLGSKEEALEIRARLEGGEDFTTLAEEFSQSWSETDKDNAGTLAHDADSIWVDYVFDDDTEIGAVSPPIKDTTLDSGTTGGYWLILVEASENRDITGENYVIMTSLLFNDWLSEVQEKVADSVINYLDYDRASWIADYLTGALS